MSRLNPYDKQRKAAETKKAADAVKNKDTKLKAKRTARKAYRKLGRNFISTYRKGLGHADTETVKEYLEYVQNTKVGAAAMKTDA